MKPIAVQDPAFEGAVLTKATLRATSLLGLSGAQLARVIGVSESTVSRLTSGQATLSPGSKSAELALLLVRVFRSLDALVGNAGDSRRAWMESPNAALGGIPRELITSAQGLVNALQYLDAMRAPV